MASKTADKTWLSNNLYYTLYFTYKVLKNIINHRGAVLPERNKEYVNNFMLTADKKKIWYEMFFANQQVEVPFTYFNRDTNVAISCIEELTNCNLKLRHFYHVKSSIWVKPDTNIELNNPYRVIHKIQDILPLNDHKVCLIARSSVYTTNSAREHIYDLKHAFLIKKLKTRDVEVYESLPHHNKHKPELYLGLSANKSQLSTLPNVNRICLYIPKKMGSKFGMLSGDLNPIHTNNTVAKLTGAKGSFIQGLCILNYLAGQFSALKYPPFEKLNMTFCNKVYENQHVYLLYLNSKFEVVDANNQLLLFGRIK